MKKLTKILTIVVAVCLVLSLAACGDGKNTDSGKETDPLSGGAGYTFKFRGVDIAVDADLAPIVASLGEPTDYFESDSCAFQGKDKVWTYGGVILRSYPEGGKDLVLNVELKDDTVATPEGIAIGSSEADVKAVYGDPASSTSAACEYVKGACKLTFLLNSGKVSGITYSSRVLDS